MAADLAEASENEQGRINSCVITFTNTNTALLTSHCIRSCSISAQFRYLVLGSCVSSDIYSPNNMLAILFQA